jgi:methionyl-tRNA synthetase
MNGDLANDFGNLAQRVLSMVNKNCGAAVPQPGAFTPADETLLGAADGLRDRLRSELDAQAFHRALDAIWQVVGDANRYVDEQAPWALKKTDPARMGTVLYVLAETVRILALVTQPFVPDSCAKLLDQLTVDANARSFAALGDRLTPGTPLPKPEGVFPRFVEDAAAS